MTRMEILISAVLRCGVILCAVVIAFGLIAGFMRPEASSQQLQLLMQGKQIQIAQSDLSPPHVVKKVLVFDSDAIILFGLLLLIALPIARVALTVVLFLREGEWIYVGITLFVFTILMLSFILGKNL